MVRPDNTGNSKILTEDRLHFLPKFMIDMVVISSFVLPGQIVAGLAASFIFRKSNSWYTVDNLTTVLCYLSPDHPCSCCVFLGAFLANCHIILIIITMSLTQLHNMNISTWFFKFLKQMFYFECLLTES